MPHWRRPRVLAVHTTVEFCQANDAMLSPTVDVTMAVVAGRALCGSTPAVPTR